MIMSRISLFGGATDYLTWFRERRSIAIDTAIDKCYYISFCAIPLRSPIIARASTILRSNRSAVSPKSSSQHGPEWLLPFGTRYAGCRQVTTDVPRVT